MFLTIGSTLITVITFSTQRADIGGQLVCCNRSSHIIDTPSIIILGISNSLAVELKIGIREPLNTSASTSGISITLTRITVIGENRAKVGTGIPVSVTVSAIGAGV